MSFSNYKTLPANMNASVPILDPAIVVNAMDLGVLIVHPKEMVHEE
jgi:hypothetical protein